MPQEMGGGKYQEEKGTYVTPSKSIRCVDAQLVKRLYPDKQEVQHQDDFWRQEKWQRQEVNQSHRTPTSPRRIMDPMGQDRSKHLNNFFTMADAKKQWNKENDKACIICEGKHFTFKCPLEGVTGKIARERIMRAGACMNCFRTDHLANKCTYKGCRIQGCGRRHNWRLHDPVLHGPFFGGPRRKLQKVSIQDLTEGPT